MVKLRAPGHGKHGNVQIEGTHDYAVDDYGIVDAHPSHVQAFRMLGFTDPDVDAPKPIEVSTKPAEDAQKPAEQAAKDEFDAMNLAQITQWLKDQGVADAAPKSKAAGREQCRSVVKAGAGASSDVNDEEDEDEDPLA